MGSWKVLEKSWIFFVSKRVGTLSCTLHSFTHSLTHSLAGSEPMHTVQDKTNNNLYLLVVIDRSCMPSLLEWRLKAHQQTTQLSQILCNLLSSL